MISAVIADAVTGLLSIGPRQQNDRSVLAELDVHRRTERLLPAGLTLEWLGTAGFRLTYAGTSVVIDPYLSRHSFASTISMKALHGDPNVVARYVPQCDAVLIGHTHFDHAIDVPRIAAACRCAVYGSSSLARLMALHDLADRAVQVITGKVYSVGPFEITFVESAHSKLALGLKVPFDGELSCDHLDDLRGGAYRCGQIYGIHIRVAGMTFYHQGSAELLDDRTIHRGVDVFLMGIAGRVYSSNFVARALRKLEPRVVVPHHFDDFFRPLDAPMGFSLNVNLGGFVEEVRRVSGDFTVRTLAPLEPWTGS